MFFMPKAVNMFCYTWILLFYKYGLQSLSYQGSKLLTELPVNLKDQSNLVKFQVKLKDS